MRILLLLVFTHIVVSQSSQKYESLAGKEKKDSTTNNLQKLQDLLQEKLQTSRLNSKVENSAVKTKTPDDLKNSSRKPKSVGYFPYFPPPPMHFGLPPPGFFYPQNKEVMENGYPGEWLSRTEPFKKNPPLLDSPTYYIRLPPNPYMFVPGLGYVSRPPSLSDPEVIDNGKPEQSNQVGNDVLHNPFYRVPINFLANGKPTSVYQLPNTQAVPKPESSLINLTKGPYVFNGKPSEIYLIAQIYDALYGDELAHFYP